MIREIVFSGPLRGEPRRAYAGSVGTDGKHGRGERIGIVVNNMIPALGILLLGWDAVPVLVMLWLDGWMGVWEVAAAACVAVAREEPSVVPARIRGLRRSLYWVLTYLFVLLIASIPSFLALAGLAAVAGDQYSIESIGGALADTSLIAAVVLNVVLRLLQGFVISPPPARREAAFTLEEKYHLVAFKAVAMFMLASYVGDWGRISLIVYVFLVCGFLTWAELNPDRVLHLLKLRRRTAEA